MGLEWVSDGLPSYKFMTFNQRHLVARKSSYEYIFKNSPQIYVYRPLLKVCMLLHLLHCVLFQLSRNNVLVLHLLSELLASSKTYLVYVSHVDIGVLKHIAF